MGGGPGREVSVVSVTFYGPKTPCGVYSKMSTLIKSGLELLV